MELAEIGKNILINCMNVKPGENVLIVTEVCHWSGLVSGG